MCNGQRTEPCNVFPKNQYIEVGSSTEVVCQTTCVRGRVFWTLDNSPIDESLSRTINSSHTVLTLRNFTHHSATLQCHSADTQQVLGGTTIRTYSKPSKISCMLESENQHGGVPEWVKCNWEHQIISPLKINYTLIYEMPLKPKTELCHSQETNCSNKSSSGPIYMFTNATFTVRAKTTAWETSSDPYEIDPYSMYKIIPPKVKVTVLPDRLSVKWSRSGTYRICHCEVKYSKVVSDGTPEVVLKKTLGANESIGSATIENVESCTNYKISVRCAIDKAPWSNWSQEQMVLTKLNKRHVRLRLWRKIAAPEESEMRKVHAMWKEIPSTCQDTFTYTIKTTPYKDDVPGVNYTDISCDNSTCDFDVSHHAHRISLKAFQKGILLAEDSVYVPATGKSLPQVTGIQASPLGDVILVSWKAPVQPVSGYMIDWTHNGHQYYWKESKYTNTTLSGLLDKKRYNITVTPLFEDKTGRGTQAIHICSRVGDPGNVTITVDPNDKSVFVSWDTKSQEECSGTVINYTVFYGTQTGPMLNVTVDGTRQGIHLKDLSPDTQYRVYVKATSLTGTNRSSERLFKTKRFDPRLLLALSVCGSIIIILVLSLGLFCAIKWKKFSEKPVPNPGLSSVALWTSPSHQKGKGSFQPFDNPSESLFDQIYTEATQKTSTSPLATSYNSNPAGGQTEEYTEAATVVAPEEQNEKPVGQRLCSPGESTALLSSEKGKHSPYRSQSSVESPTSMSNKLCKRVPVKQLEKSTPVTVYVTLDMFEQGQSR
ncbi:hypothetical protein Q5P01_004794 [Channa striata]|uniref:Fibronectin type-III domain-containing protein n=1 Tax=Channa striata TaxID=64152 RepID=A0AA88SYT7_CHASR|nr:hypothetical protein Q5P01_004794 [Channa striata]